MSRSEHAAIGFRVKSGWALAVLVVGPADAPRVLDRCVVELSDAEVPETRQPYHASTGKEETDQAKIKRRVKAVERVANRTVAELTERHRKLSSKLRAACLVVGSLVEPEKIANAHIRAHAHEGKLFRSVLEQALQDGGVRCQVVRERDAYAKAAAALQRPAAELKRVTTAMGAAVGRPWSANEKLAALAAWMSLV